MNDDDRDPVEPERDAAVPHTLHSTPHTLHPPPDSRPPGTWKPETRNPKPASGIRRNRNAMPTCVGNVLTRVGHTQS